MEYIASQENLEAFVRRAASSSVLAIDTEFLREKTYYANLCLIQLATDAEVAVVDPFAIEDMKVLAPLLTDSSIVKLFHAGGQDLEILYRELGVLPAPLFDTQVAATLLGHTQQIGYGPLVHSLCGVNLKKSDSFTDWSRRPLSTSQLEYAADDVIYLPKMYRIMVEKLEAKGRLHWLDNDFAAMSDEELLEHVQSLKIMSRARPLDKQRLVRLLQQCGEVVAVTGDGTNDAPALNFANVGLSMGSGTSVAKDASDITLLDDSFTSIATAVMWGRSLYRNIQRFVLFQLTINFAAIVICFVGAVFGTDMPLTVVQILWVNIIMDTFAAMAMASLPPSPEVMLEKPRPRDEFIITPGMARTILTCGVVIVAVLLGMLFWWTSQQGELTIRQLTLFFSVFVFLQFWNMFNAKGFETRHSVFTCLKRCREFFLILLAIAVGQVLIVEWGGEVFRTVPLTGGEWAEVIGLTSLLAFGGEAVRALRRHANRKN